MTVAPLAADADDTDQTIGLNVHGLLYRRRASQKELALALGVTPSVLSKKLRGESAWSARQVAVTAEYLEVAPGRLYSKSQLPNPVPVLTAIDGGGNKTGGHNRPLMNIARQI